MKSILRKAFWPAAVAGLMVAMFGALGTGAVKTAYAYPGDVCAAQVVGPGGVMDTTWENGVQHNPVYTVHKGVTYGLVFRIENNGDYLLDNVDHAGVLVDSEGGSAKITSQMEVADLNGPFDANTDVDSFPNFYDPNVYDHTHAGVNSATVDVIEPYDFNDADGHPLDSIADFVQSNGFNASGVLNARSVCDNGNFTGPDDESTKNCYADGVNAPVTTDCLNVDGWGFINFQCNEFGTFYIDISGGYGSSSNDAAIKFVCPGVPDSATISAFPTSVETYPSTAGIVTNSSTSTITVTVSDQDGNRFDGAHVTLTTDNCTFIGDSGATSADLGGQTISPAAGGTTVDIVSDTDSTTDHQYVVNNPLQTSAGTAEAVLNCAGTKGTPGTAHITAVVNRPGQDVVLSTTVAVVGPTSANGLQLTLSATSVQCGNPILATVKAVDANGVAVSDGTPIYFTTDTSSGIVGGTLAGGAQGGVPTVGGASSVNIATDPGNPGTHTVIAYVLNGAGGVAIQQTATYSCTVPAPPAPTVPAPATGTGTGSITPPNTGDAGLAATNTGTSSLFVIAGAVALALAGFATFKFSRNS